MCGGALLLLHLNINQQILKLINIQEHLKDNVYIWIDKHCKDITTETPRKAKMEDITVTITKSSGWKYWLHDKSTELKVTVKGKE